MPNEEATFMVDTEDLPERLFCQKKIRKENKHTREKTMKFYSTCSNFKPKKNIREWKIELILDDLNVPEEWKTNPWSLVGEGFEITRVEKKEE